MSAPDVISPLVQTYIDKNPNGLLARLMTRTQANKPNPLLAGSNNAGKPTQTPDTRPPPHSGGGHGDGFSMPGSRGMMTNTPYMASGGPINNPNYDAMNSGGVMHNDWSFDGSHAPPPLDFGGIPSFAAGGMMEEDGTAARPNAAMSANIVSRVPSAIMSRYATKPNKTPSDGVELGAATPQQNIPGPQIDAQAQQFVRAHPEEVAKIKGLMVHAIQTGQITPEKLNMLVQLARIALANPSSYPQVRQYAIDNGLGTDADIPQQYDQGLMYVLLVAGKSMQSTVNAPQQAGATGDALQSQPPSPTQQPQAGILPEYGDGGPTGDTKHLAQLHPHEYVIPADVVRYHGKKTFDNLVTKARDPNNG